MRTLLLVAFTLASTPVFSFNTAIDTTTGQADSASASAIEYYHAGFGHYFVTGSADEAAAIDSGAIKGWARTGQTYSVYAQSGAGLSPVCRFFTTSFAPKSSHFYTPSAAECVGVKSNANWQYEGNAFYVNEPTSGVCPVGTASLYRIYNNGRSGAPNHRYTTCATIRDKMVSRGWVSEGVAMCVPGGGSNCAIDSSGGGVNYTAVAPPTDAQIAAFKEVAIAYAQSRMKSPSSFRLVGSSNFVYYPETQISYISFTYEAQNSFGVYLRGTGYCPVKIPADGIWSYNFLDAYTSCLIT